ncbi:MAG: sigma-70 family RNA polymerase sigma factor [Pseudomonadota bacterium]|nr:sigma-70 family RNA polymerase sigma factor [Pseudomonadota bacterium]
MATTTTDRNARLAELLARTALADQTAFAELYRIASGPLYGVALRMLRDRSAAEEVLQEAFVSVWHHAGTYAASKSQPLTWLTSIVRNRCLDQLRKRELDTVSMTRDAEHEGEPAMDFAADSPTPVDMLITGAEGKSVRNCVETLEGGQKQAIALAFFGGLTHAELAAQLRQPLGTIKSWVRRGLERLRQCLDHSGYVH